MNIILTLLFLVLDLGPNITLTLFLNAYRGNVTMVT